MKTVGVLSWFDESASMLANCVAGMARMCDEIVAVDGGYRLFPGARPRSLPEQSEAILGACEAAGVGCTVHRPRDVFHGNEVEKRNLTLRVARAHCEESDWLMVCDADFLLMKANPDVFRADLEQTEAVVGSYAILDGKDMLADPGVAELARQTDLDTEWTTRVRFLYRWHPTLTYGPTHWTVGRYLNGEWVWLNGPGLELEPAVDVSGSLVCVHRRESRALVRLRAAAGYQQAREAHGVEEGVLV